MTTQREALEKSLAAMRELRSVVRYFWHDDSQRIGDLDEACGATDDAISSAEEAVSKCPCGDRQAADCPGQWEPGCDLGANEKFALRVSAEQALRRPEPSARRMTEEEVEAIVQQHYSPDISPADWARDVARATESVLASLWEVKLP